MVSQRDRIIELEQFFKTAGIEVNIGKNKARGNKGFFKVVQNAYRIDISKNLSDDEILGVLVHEFMHFLHYKYDKTLSSLDFIFDKINDELMEELLAITVKAIPKTSVEPLFKMKNEFKSEIKSLSLKLNEKYSDFKPALPFRQIERQLSKTPQKYLLKYDRVKVNEGFSTKVYSIDLLDSYEDLNSDMALYLKLKSKQRALKRVNSKIARLNKYYNSCSELLARAVELYVADNVKFAADYPGLTCKFEQIIMNNKIPLFTELIKITL